MRILNQQHITQLHFRSAVKFLDTPRPGMYRQKALDLKIPAALPQFFFLKRARGIDEVEKDSEDEADAEENDDEAEAEAANKLNKNVGKFGDIE